MKTASGSPGSELPGEPGTSYMADRGLVASSPDAVPNPANDGREPEHRCHQGRHPLPGGTTEELDNRAQVTQKQFTHRQCAVI